MMIFPSSYPSPFPECQSLSDPLDPYLVLEPLCPLGAHSGGGGLSTSHQSGLGTCLRDGHKPWDFLIFLWEVWLKLACVVVTEVGKRVEGAGETETGAS